MADRPYQTKLFTNVRRDEERCSIVIEDGAVKKKGKV